MPAAARLGDGTSHGGMIVCGEPSVLIGSKWAARLGDPHVCPMSDGPKPHVGGAVTSASNTVWIGGAPAARVGDACLCPSAGMTGRAVPAVVGPGLPALILTTDPHGRTLEELDEAEAATGPHAELVILDTDRDGTYDTARARASAARMRNEADGEVGPFRFTADHELDVGYAEKTVSLSSDGGVAIKDNTEIGMVRHGGSVTVGPAGEEGANPHLKLRGEYGVATAEGETDVFFGSDGPRHGFSMMGGSEAKGLGGELGAETSIPIPFTDWTIETGVSVEADALSVGESGGVAMYYDSSRQRMNWKYKLPIGWLGLDVGLNLSIGSEHPTVDLRGILVGSLPPAPNQIVTGDYSVLIG